MTPAPATGTVDAREIDTFTRMAEEWWDPSGPFAPLHALNPARIGYIRDTVCKTLGRPVDGMRPLDGLAIIDIGCGGGLVSEPLARLGAAVTGLDAGARNIAVASAHAASRSSFWSATPCLRASRRCMSRQNAQWLSCEARILISSARSGSTSRADAVDSVIIASYSSGDAW